MGLLEYPGVKLQVFVLTGRSAEALHETPFVCSIQPIVKQAYRQALMPSPKYRRPSQDAPHNVESRFRASDFST